MEPRAYVYALLTILCWSSLAAVVGDALRTLHPFQALFYSFFFASLTLLIMHLARRGRRGFRRPSVLTMAVGTWGVFGYHVLYYIALKRAPVVEASIINYLWPLLIVVFSSLFGGERFRPVMLTGALMGCAGTVLTATGGRSFSPDAAYLPGYVAALGAALAWSSFSVLLKRVRSGGTSDMLAFCLITALLGGLLMVATGNLSLPPVRELLLLAYTGVCPLALAFFFWERAIHLGRVQVIGNLAYLTPFLSTFLLWALLDAPVSGGAAAGLAMIVGGAAIGATSGRRKPTEGAR